MILKPPEDIGYVGVFCVLPGRELPVGINTENEKSLGIYFLFTYPGNNWKQFYDLGEGGATINIELGVHEIL
jgi:hypothetical protein